MVQTEKRTVYATLDIGTSQIKLGVYCPAISERIIVIGSLGNQLSYGDNGEVRADYNLIREQSFRLFTQLGAFLKREKITELQLGICGHVSSLFEWNRHTRAPTPVPFPIWLDTSCYGSLAKYNEVMGNGKSKDIIGTFLPAGTNWLFTKLLYRKDLAPTIDSIFLQVGDALYFDLCGGFKTHFSSQISMVDLRTRNYSSTLMKELELNYACLPEISYDATHIGIEQIKVFGFPDDSFVFPAMADLYTSLYGLRLKDKEGFVLANTSEQAGAYYSNRPAMLDNFLSISFADGFVNYGSTNTGGNVVNWFLESVLGKTVTADLLNELTIKAALIDPEHTPIILPYLQGERAPLWNSRLTASILELKSSHTEIHLFRAILEAIAFARRQCFVQLGYDDLALIKIGGGSSRNEFWNSIRATVLNKPMMLADEKELAITGVIDYMIAVRKDVVPKPAIDFSLIQPQQELVLNYESKYRKFINYQKVIADCSL